MCVRQFWFISQIETQRNWFRHGQSQYYIIMHDVSDSEVCVLKNPITVTH